MAARHQRADLFVRRVAGQRLHEALLDVPQLPLGERQIPVFDAQRGVPEQPLHRIDRRRQIVGEAQAPDYRA